MFDACRGEPRSGARPEFSPRRREEPPPPRWTLRPRRPGSSPFRATSARRQPRLGNGSLLKSFMSTPQKRKARRKREEGGDRRRASAALLLSHAMIYDVAVATDLIITVYFPSAGENGEVSDFGPLSFLLFCFTNTFCLFFCVSVLTSPPPPRAHFATSLLNSQIQLKKIKMKQSPPPPPPPTTSVTLP